MSIGERLKSLRVSLKKTLKDESELFDVSINTVYRWEHNLTVPRKGVLKKVAEFYNVPFEWILHGDFGDENSKCAVCIMNPESDIEYKLLKMFRKLPDINKYKILGYVERMLVENGLFE